MKKKQNKKWKKKSKEKQVLLLFHADQKSLNDFFMTDKGFSLHSFEYLLILLLLLLLFSLRLSIYWFYRCVVEDCISSISGVNRHKNEINFHRLFLFFTGQTNEFIYIFHSYFTYLLSLWNLLTFFLILYWKKKIDNFFIFFVVFFAELEVVLDWFFWFLNLVRLVWVKSIHCLLVYFFLLPWFHNDKKKILQKN